MKKSDFKFTLFSGDIYITNPIESLAKAALQKFSIVSGLCINQKKSNLLLINLFTKDQAIIQKAYQYQ